MRSARRARVGAERRACAASRAGAKIGWWPSSNLFLLGQLRPPPLLAEGVDVLLGSDALTTTGIVCASCKSPARWARLDERLRAAWGQEARRPGSTCVVLAVGVQGGVVRTATALSRRRRPTSDRQRGGCSRARSQRWPRSRSGLQRECPRSMTGRWTSISCYAARQLERCHGHAPVIGLATRFENDRRMGETRGGSVRLLARAMSRRAQRCSRCESARIRGRRRRGDTPPARHARSDIGCHDDTRESRASSSRERPLQA